MGRGRRFLTPDAGTGKAAAGPPGRARPVTGRTEPAPEATAKCAPAGTVPFRRCMPGGGVVLLGRFGPKPDPTPNGQETHGRKP